MKITVITINYNNLHGLKRTIPSVLSQTCHDFEYIVVDGGSTDGSKEYIESQKGIDRWVSEKDKGIYNAMNKGISMAHGEYCIFMNSGDHFFSPYSLENAYKELDGTDYCVGRTAVVENNNSMLFMVPPTKMSLLFIKNNFLMHQSTFIKTSLLKEHPYDEELKIISDWSHFFELWHNKKCTYKAMEYIISVFYFDGISFAQRDTINEEKKLVINRILGDKADLIIPRTQEEKREWITDRLKFKLESAMKKSPLSRDWKLIRNGIKFFIKDLFLYLRII